MILLFATLTVGAGALVLTFFLLRRHVIANRPPDLSDGRDPFAGVRQPGPTQPPGRSSGVALDEPHD